MTSGGVVVPKIGEEGEKKKGQKKFLCGSPKRGGGRKGREGAQGFGLRACGGPDLCLEWSNHSRLCRDPPGFPRSSQSPPESLREERFPEAPWGRHRPMEQVSVPLSHTREWRKSHWPATLLRLFFPARLLPAVSSPSQRGPYPCATFPDSYPFPDAPGTGRRRGAPRRAAFTRYPFSIPTSVLSLTALQPHPRVNFCPLPPEQCYQPPGVPDDRGPSWVGSHGAPQRLQVRIGGESRVCGSLSQGEGERSPGVVVYICSPCFGSVSRGSRQTGASSALEAWMLRSIRSPTCWQIWTGVAVMLLGDQTDRSVSCFCFPVPSQFSFVDSQPQITLSTPHLPSSQLMDAWLQEAQEARASFLSGLVPGNLSKVIASPGLPPGLHEWWIWPYSLFLHCLSPQAFEAPPPHAYRAGSLKPSGGAGPTPMLPTSPYGGPTPASYATASTPAGPAFPVQVKVAQPVRGCGLPRRGASQASGPLPGPHFPLPGRGEVWGSGYRGHREPGPGVKEEAAGIHGPAGGGRGGGHGPQVSQDGGQGALCFVVIVGNWTLIGLDDLESGVT